MLTRRGLAVLPLLLALKPCELIRRPYGEWGEEWGAHADLSWCSVTGFGETPQEAIDNLYDAVARAKMRRATEARERGLQEILHHTT